MTYFGDVYRNRRVLITGHTGFKGSWLSMWLREVGAVVTGIALDPSQADSHWDLLKLEVADHRQDVRDAAAVRKLVEAANPEIVFHLAAQPLVRRSYRDPLGNWSTNVMGTAHVLDACRHVESVRAVVAVTTDKVYVNQERPRGYREDDALGGQDPYSASKAACEILVESYRAAFFGTTAKCLVASARAGNVVGGGDWSEDRLVPDLVRSLRAGTPLIVRFPAATRPWQHVLDCLSGYLMLGWKLLQGERQFASAWNFGPAARDARPVSEVLELLRQEWPKLEWKHTDEPQPKEAMMLCLDSSKARKALGWAPVWDLEAALEATAAWYRQFQDAGAVCSRDQLQTFMRNARATGAVWAAP